MFMLQSAAKKCAMLSSFDRKFSCVIVTLSLACVSCGTGIPLVFGEIWLCGGSSCSVDAIRRVVGGISF